MYIYIYIYIHEQETTVCMCYTVAIKKKHKVCLTNFRILLMLSHVLYIVIYTEIYMYYI